jgi:Na+-transporting NADH:ubiquinone oxidoreductase subunit NqrF
VVNAQYLLSLVNATCKDTCQACDGDAECAQCWVEMLRQESTAAIDAASKEARRDE